MSGTPRVLVLTAATGGGHLSLAEAVRDLLKTGRTAGLGGADVDVVDPLPGIARAHYRLVSRHATGVWAAEYAFLDGRRRAAVAHRLWALPLAGRIARILATRRYDVVLSAYSFLTYEAAAAIRRLGRPVPLAMLLTDAATLHASWLSQRATATTFAPTRETHALALDAGFPADRLHLVGWPVRAQFRSGSGAGSGAGGHDDVRAATLGALGLDPRAFTAFVQGGGEGAAGFARSVEAITSTAGPGVVQVLLAPGSNATLGARFAGVGGVRVVPTTRQIAPFVAACDVVVGKAGPNAVMEATYLGKPFVATTFIPGQEADNLQFVARHGLGWVALGEREQVALVRRLAADPALLASRRAAMERYRTWNDAATAQIPALVGSLAGTARPAPAPTLALRRHAPGLGTARADT